MITIKGENSHFVLLAIVAIVAVVGLTTVLKSDADVQPTVVLVPSDESFFEEVSLGAEDFTGDMVKSNGTRYYRRRG